MSKLAIHLSIGVINFVKRFLRRQAVNPKTRNLSKSWKIKRTKNLINIHTRYLLLPEAISFVSIIKRQAKDAWKKKKLSWEKKLPEKDLVKIKNYTFVQKFNPLYNDNYTLLYTYIYMSWKQKLNIKKFSINEQR